MKIPTCDGSSHMTWLHCVLGDKLAFYDLRQTSQWRINLTQYPLTFCVCLSVYQPLRCRIEKLLNISDVPTASGTYVPQQQPPANNTPTSTTFTFGTLMRHLSERHPLLGREKILEALLELRAHHGGSLNCLTLDTLVEMTSEHITAQTPEDEEGNVPEA